MRIGTRLSPGRVVLLRGPLGAGKTVLAKGIAAGLGVTDVVTSPTYTIVSDYEGRVALHHIDLYRITGDEEYDQLGLDELFESDAVSLVEWPERAGSALPDTAALIEVTIDDDGRRRISGPDELLTAEEPPR